MPTGIPKDKARRSQLQVVRGKRNQINREKDMWYAATQVARGKTYTEIAEDLNEKNEDYQLTSMTVRNDIESMLVDWKRENMENIDSYITKELFRLEELERVTMENFEASKALSPQDYVAFIKRGYSIEEVDEIFSIRPRSGNPAYLQTLLNLQMQKLKLLGIDKGNDVAQNTIINYNFGDMDENMLAGIADSLQDNKMKEILAEKVVDEQ